MFADCIDDIIREFKAVWERHGGGHQGKPHDVRARSYLFPFNDQSEYLSALLDDPRILGIAYPLVGDDFNYRTTGGSQQSAVGRILEDCRLLTADGHRLTPLAQRAWFT